jgi:hypothetical protein
MLGCFSYLSQSEIIMGHSGRIGCYDVLLILANQKLLWSFWMLGCFWYLNQSEIIMGHSGRIGCYDVLLILANQKLLYSMVVVLDVMMFFIS